MFNAPLGEIIDDLVSDNLRPAAKTQLGVTHIGIKPSTAPGHTRNRTYNYASNKETGTAAQEKFDGASS